MNTSFAYTKNRDRALTFLTRNTPEQHRTLIATLITQLIPHPTAQHYLESTVTQLETSIHGDPQYLDTNPLHYFLVSKIKPLQAAQLSVQLTLWLTAHEQVPGGPYFTATKTDQNKTDPLHNAYIHFTLQHFGVHLPKLEAYVINTIITDQWRTGIYPAWLYLYLLYISVSASRNSTLQKYIQTTITTEPASTPLDIACKILITQDYALVRAQDSVPRFTSMTTFTAITAALWAIIWNQNDPQTKVVRTITSESTIAQSIKDQAISLVAKKLAGLDTELQATGLLILGKLLITPIATEIILLATHWGQAFRAPINQATYSTLGAANIFGWIAHHLYQTAEPNTTDTASISLANICLRSATEYYLEIAALFGLDKKLVLQTFDAIDQAHAAVILAQQELRSCKENNRRWTGTPMRHLAECSFGHCLGPLLITQWQESHSGLLEQVKKLCNHYLAARQICDDLHDWSRDYAHYQVTSVTKNLFFTTQAFKCINEFQAKKIFWHEGIDLHIHEANQEIEAALRLMQKIKWPHSYPMILWESLQTLKQSLQQVRSERSAIKTLITTYQV